VVVTKPGDPVALHYAEPKIEIHRDCVYVPVESGNFWENRYWGVYDSNGNIIDGAAFRSLPGMALNGQSSRCIADVADAPYAPRDCYFYVGNLINHYGHFICSSMSRLWALNRVEIGAVPLIGHSLGSPIDWFSWPFARTLFGAAGVVQEDFADFRRPVRIRQLVVAYPSFVELNLAHTIHAQAAHLWGDRLVKTQDLSNVIDVIYISKSRFGANPAGLSNEAELAAALERRGVPIVYPENMSIPEQVALFRRSKRILGQVGSAFHTEIFSEPMRDQVFIKIVPSPHVYSTNHALIDLANINLSYYLYFDGETHEREGAQPGFRIADPETVARALLDFAGQI